MEHLVVSLDIAKQLKAAGFPQDGVQLWWAEAERDAPALTLYRSQFELDAESEAPGFIRYPGIWSYQSIEIGTWEETFAAPTAQEIADQLPQVNIYRDGSAWRVKPAQKGKGWVAGLTMADALALLYLKLHEALSSESEPRSAEDTDAKP